ncbi:MAG: GtrA family protein [Anaerolineales bacterium]|nr:MAG: GtrA family protein [Anaerolineales bacterium]
MKFVITERNRRELSRFLRFSVVGVIGAVLDFGSFNLFANVLGIASVIASVLSFTTAVTSNFIWNRFWTYPDSRSKTIRQQAVQFGVISMIGLAIRTPIFALAEQPMMQLVQRFLDSSFTQTLPGWVPIQAFDPGVLGANLALALAVVIVLFWNFFANRLWTYSDAT